MAAPTRIHDTAVTRADVAQGRRIGATVVIRTRPVFARRWQQRLTVYSRGKKWTRTVIDLDTVLVYRIPTRSTILTRVRITLERT